MLCISFSTQNPSNALHVVPEALSPKDQLNAVCMWERLFFLLLEHKIPCEGRNLWDSSHAAGVPQLLRWEEVVLVWPSLLECLLDQACEVSPQSLIKKMPAFNHICFRVFALLDTSLIQITNCSGRYEDSEQLNCGTGRIRLSLSSLYPARMKRESQAAQNRRANDRWLIKRGFQATVFFS